jgi:uncharacterized membrane protein
MKLIWVLLLMVPVVLIIDLIWLGIIMKGFYNQEIGGLMRKSGSGLAPRWSAAIVVYLLIPAGLLLFVRPMLGDNPTLPQTFGWGALFGLIMYGVYDFTNLAVLEKWTLKVTLADVAWGGFLCGVCMCIARMLENWFGK